MNMCFHRNTHTLPPSLIGSKNSILIYGLKVNISIGCQVIWLKRAKKALARAILLFFIQRREMAVLSLLVEFLCVREVLDIRIVPVGTCLKR